MDSTAEEYLFIGAQGVIFQTSEYFKSLSVLGSLHVNPESLSMKKVLSSPSNDVSVTVSVLRSPTADHDLKW